MDLAEAILKLHADISVEIGVYAGRSLVPMAMAHAEMNHGVVWGIDPWTPQASVAGQGKADAEWWGKLDHEIMYQKTLDTLARLGLTGVVNILRATSDAVEPPDVIDFLHLDGNHSEQSVRDVERYANRVRNGGMVFLDDVHWSNHGVEHAKERLLGMGFELVSTQGTGEMFRRVSGGVEVKKPEQPPDPKPESKGKVKSKKHRRRRMHTKPVTKKATPGTDKNPG